MRKLSSKKNPSYEKTLEKYSKALARGEKSRILYECFLDSLSMTYENTFGETMTRMKEVQAEYEEAVNFFGGLMKRQHEAKNTPLNDDVSIGHN